MALPLPDPRLHDDLVSLREFAEHDVPALVSACQDPAIARFTFMPSPYSEADARAWLRTCEEERRSERGLHLAVADRAHGKLVGGVGLAFEWQHRRAEIGYWIAAHARGGGRASSAVAMLSRWVLGELGLARVELLPDVENVISQRVAERCGFVREGVLRSRVEAKGRRWDQVMYALLPADLAE